MQSSVEEVRGGSIPGRVLAFWKPGISGRREEFLLNFSVVVSAAYLRTKCQAKPLGLLAPRQAGFTREWTCTMA